jgi:uncharacterized protein (TIGR03437 family)
MSLILRRIGLAILVVCAVCGYAQPVVNSAVNAASYLTPPSSGTPATATPAPIAQGSIFVVFGTAMGGPNQSTTLPLQTSMGGTSVSVTSGGQTVAAYMVYVFPTQLAAILPSTTPVGAATLTVTTNSQTSKSINIVVTPAVPGIFTWNAQGTGPGVAQVALSSTNILLNNLTTPGTPGAVMILYGTGLGPITGVADNVAPGPVTTPGTVTVTVGGTQATVLYAGRAPQFPGEDQINIQLPQTVPLGCYTPAVVTVNGVPSNDFLISTGSAQGSCVHPFGLSAQAEAALDSQGAASLVASSTATANVGVFAAVRGEVPPIIAEGAGGLFESANEAELYNTYEIILANFHVVYYPAPVGGCVVYDELAISSGLSIPSDFTGIGSKELQPAASLLVSGPNNVSQGIIRAGSAGPGSGYLWVNILGAATPPELGPGTYTLSGAAGPDIAAFSAPTQVPANVTWPNVTSIQPQIAGTTITWTGGGTSAQPNMNIFGNSSVYNPTDPSKNRGKSFSCIVPATASPYAIPTSVTGLLPTAGASEIASGEVGISNGGGSQFSATLTSGKPLDGSFFGFGEAFVASGVAWK